MKIGLVGCGIIGLSHLKKVKKLLPDAKIFLCDVDEMKCQAFAEKYSIDGFYTSIEDLLEKEIPESVHILTPPSFHFEVTKKCLEAGSNVFIEKPITNTSSEFKTLVELAKRKNKILCGDYSTLGMPIVLRAKEEVKTGELGRLISMHIDWAGSPGDFSIPYSDPYHWAYKLRGGILKNMIDHPVSVVLSFLDSVDDFKTTFLSRNVLPNDVYDLVQITFNNDDQIGSLLLSFGHGCNHRKADLLFEAGVITLDFGKQLYYCTKGRGRQNFVKKAFGGISEGNAYIFGTTKNLFDTLTGKLQKDPGITNIMSNYYDAILHKQELIVPHSLITQIASILDKVWDEMEMNKNKKNSFIEEYVK